MQDAREFLKEEVEKISACRRRLVPCCRFAELGWGLRLAQTWRLIQFNGQ